MELSTAQNDVQSSESVMRMLGAGVPLSLLIDLTALDLAMSVDIARVERADASWVHRAA